MNNNRPRKILVLFAHPAIRKSRVNKRLLEAVRDLDGVTVNQLYESYPDLDIDIEREHELLSDHDVVVLQHPFYWYSTPSILKEWQDLVLEHGWAFGHGGNALAGKMLLNVISTGGSESSYSREGLNKFTMRELLAPIEQTARLCKMSFLPPFVIHGTHAFEDVEIGRHATDYRRLMQGFRDGRIDLERARKMNRINSDLDLVLGEQ
jgi:glutathione-regulated potassium-efflux system ancillary protein KefG